MSKKINILEENIVNKIAAGEVVERPASVVKELLENSIDAKSTRINIDILSGGKKLIKISDNGVGIGFEDVENAFLRHSTSKIRTVDDLYRINSMGFRGEALSSISAVSRVCMVTKTSEQDVGIKININGGSVESKIEIGTTRGTTMSIEDLFFNTPARKKFLKSDMAENLAINEIINKLAIGHPHIKFTYKNNNKIMLTTPGDGDLKNTIRSIYGKDISENLVCVDSDFSILKIEGFIGNNNIYRGNRGMEHFYINGRFVKSKFLYKVLGIVYKSILPINKYPVCFLNIEIDPSSTDVNIHPSKLEVKFDREDHIKNILVENLKKMLITDSLIYEKKTYDSKPSIKESSSFESVIGVESLSSTEISMDKLVEKIEGNIFDIIDDNTTRRAERMQALKDDGAKAEIAEIVKEIVDDKKVPSNESLEAISEPVLIKDLIRETPVSDYSKRPGVKVEDDEIDTVEKTGKDVGSQLVYMEEGEIVNDEASKTQESQAEDSKNSKLREIRIVGSLFATYIIAQDSKSMYLIDQHAAHERIMYEEYMNKFKNEEVKTQLLLQSHVMDMSIMDISIVEENMELLKTMGFEIEFFGDASIIIRGVPNLFGAPQAEKFIYEVIDSINEEKDKDVYSLKTDKIASLACKAAIKGNSSISEEEKDFLLKDLLRCENPYTCPHGRPVIVTLSKKEIEKMFKRIQ